MDEGSGREKSTVCRPKSRHKLWNLQVVVGPTRVFMDTLFEDLPTHQISYHGLVTFLTQFFSADDIALEQGQWIESHEHPCTLVVASTACQSHFFFPTSNMARGTDPMAISTGGSRYMTPDRRMARPAW